MKNAFMKGGPTEGKQGLRKYKTELKQELKKFDTKKLGIRTLEQQRLDDADNRDDFDKDFTINKDILNFEKQQRKQFDLSERRRDKHR